MDGNVNQPNQPPPPPPRVCNKDATIYYPLVLPTNLNDLPDNYLKMIPKFNSENEVTVVEHISFFDEFANDFGLEHEDVYMGIFVQTFNEGVITWFKGLQLNSLTSWDALETIFLRQWCEKKDHLYYLTEFGALKQKNNESIYDFIKIFNTTYSKIPVDVKLSKPTAKVTFAGAFDPYFSLLLRERRSRNLSDMQEDAIEIESNMMTSREFKVKVETWIRETRKLREHRGSSTANKNS
jgi:hypothetical protein